MRIAKYAKILILFTLVLSGCGKNVTLYNQAKKHYKAGEFESALESSAQSLQLKPGYLKAQDLLKEVYPRALKLRMDNVNRLKAANDALMWDKLVPEYEALIKIQTTMSGLPRLVHPKTGEVFMYDPIDYNPQLKESRENAAEYHYQKGLQLSRQSEAPEIQKEAAKEFKLAVEFVSGYKDSLARYEQARKKAVKRIAILAFEDVTGTKSRFGGLPDMLVDNIVGNLINDKASAEFLEIISRAQIDAVLQEQQLSASGLVDESSTANLGQLLGAHEILSGKILQIDSVPARTTSVQLKESATIEIEQGEAESDPESEEETEPAKIKQDVQCLYNKFTKTASARITASYTIVDVSSGKIKIQNTYTGVFEWSETWARKESGDDRALTPATKALIAKAEPFPPSDSQIVNNALKDLSDQFIKQIKGYVR